ncbi:MAG UNVERIFIED_CONTAM: Mur ligase domain-containing protein [Rickettsiaceae bacterium]|jgi:UDP-N-acetylmuramoyl-tripeptide--D-alanyl-D-alanine ligase
MTIWNEKSLSKALNVEIKNSISGGIVQFNSRDVAAGDVFIALKGDNGDGHSYVKDAIERGAACAIVEKPIDNIPNEKLIIVDDTKDALKNMAIYRELFESYFYSNYRKCWEDLNKRRSFFHCITICQKLC